MLEKSGEVIYDLPSEIYSMGAVIYYLTTGNTVIDYGRDDHMALPLEKKLTMVAEGRFRPFSKCGRLESVLRSALSISRNMRYASISGLKDALVQLQE